MSYNGGVGHKHIMIMPRYEEYYNIALDCKDMTSCIWHHIVTIQYTIIMGRYDSWILLDIYHDQNIMQIYSDIMMPYAYMSYLRLRV